MTTLILVRHAETTLNVERRYQGRSDGPLTERGVEQALALGRLLGEHLGMGDERRARCEAGSGSAQVGGADTTRVTVGGPAVALLDTSASAGAPDPQCEIIVRVSDAPRARRTAELALPALAPLVDPRLAELDFGDFDGATFEENLAAQGDAFREWILDPRAATPPGGESLEALEIRVADWLDSLRQLDPSAPIVAFTHGGPIRAALARILGIPFETLQRFEIRPGDAIRIDLPREDSATLAWPVLLRASERGVPTSAGFGSHGDGGAAPRAVEGGRGLPAVAHDALQPNPPARSAVDADSWLERICFDIPRADRAHGRSVQAHLDNLTKPVGSLGRLEHLALRLARICGDPPPALRRRTIFVLAGDHGVVAQGVSAYPQEVTVQMCANYAAGGAAVSAIARAVGADVVAVDVGVAVDAACVGIPSLKIRPGTDDLSLGPAMSREEALRAIRVGASLVEERVESSDIFALGEMGIGNTTAAAAVTAALCGVRAERVVGAGTGLDDEGIERKTAVVDRALARIPGVIDPIDVLAQVGGLEIAALVGVVLASARARKPVVMDGFITGAAVLVAVRLAPQVIDYVIASHRSREKGHAFQLTRLGLEPLLDLEMRLGEGTGAALALPLVEAAAGVLREMATFESAGVSKKDSVGVASDRPASDRPADSADARADRGGDGTVEARGRQPA